MLLNITSATLEVKLCDFGLCQPTAAVSTASASASASATATASVGAAAAAAAGEKCTVSGFCGSPGFYAPEVSTTVARPSFHYYIIPTHHHLTTQPKVLLYENLDGKKADLFSVGAIALELLTPHKFFSSHWVAAYRAARQGSRSNRAAALARQVNMPRRKLLEYHSYIRHASNPNQNQNHNNNNNPNVTSKSRPRLPAAALARQMPVAIMRSRAKIAQFYSPSDALGALPGNSALSTGTGAECRGTGTETGIGHDSGAGGGAGVSFHPRPPGVTMAEVGMKHHMEPYEPASTPPPAAAAGDGDGDGDGDGAGAGGTTAAAAGRIYMTPPPPLDMTLFMTLDADGERVATGNPRLYDADICALVAGLVAFSPSERADPDVLMWQLMSPDGGGGGGAAEGGYLATDVPTGVVITGDSDAHCSGGGDGDGDGDGGANTADSCGTDVMSDRYALTHTLALTLTLTLTPPLPPPPNPRLFLPPPPSALTTPS